MTHAGQSDQRIHISIVGPKGEESPDLERLMRALFTSKFDLKVDDVLVSIVRKEGEEKHTIAVLFEQQLNLIGIKDWMEKVCELYIVNVASATEENTRLGTAVMIVVI